MSSARSNGRRGQQMRDVGGNGNKPLTVSAQEVLVAPGGEELKVRQRNGDSLGRRQETRPATEDTKPMSARQHLGLKQDRAIVLLVQGMKVAHAAREVGVDRSTIHRWLNDPSFQRRVETEREALIDGMLDLHLLAGRLANAKLMELLESPDERIALRAAITLYVGGQRAYNLMDLRKRIERLQNNLQMYYGWEV